MTLGHIGPAPSDRGSSLLDTFGWGM